MPTINLKIDGERLTLDELIALEEKTTMRAIEARDLLARFVQDETGAFMEEQQARKALGALTITELFEVLRQFKAGVDNLAVPNATSNVSS